MLFYIDVGQGFTIFIIKMLELSGKMREKEKYCPVNISHSTVNLMFELNNMFSLDIPLINEGKKWIFSLSFYNIVSLFSISFPYSSLIINQRQSITSISSTFHTFDASWNSYIWQALIFFYSDVTNLSKFLFLRTFLFDWNYDWNISPLFRKHSSFASWNPLPSFIGIRDFNVNVTF